MPEENRPKRYPPIEEHGVIGDLHTVALVATDGTIDWYCCPSFDSPSVFASILDADRGGRYRIAPAHTGARTKQLYFPDTNVLITRSLDPDGVCEVQDFMPIESTSGERHRHRLIRRVLCVRGTVDMKLECEPSFDYGRAQAHARARRPRRALPLIGPLAVALLAGAARAGRHGRARELHARGGSERRVRARAREQGVVDRAHRATRRGDRRVRGDGRLLAALARQVHVQGPLARDGGPLGADAQAADVHAHRGDRRRADHEPARGARRPAQLGLPLHLDPRRRVHAVRLPPARLHRRGGRVHGLARAAHQGAPAPPGRHRPPADHVRHRRPRAPAGVRAPPLRGLSRLEARAHRQRRLEPAAARHLRRAARLGLPLQQVRLADLLRPLARAAAADRLARRPLERARRGHLGGARRPPALRLLATDELGRVRPRACASRARAACPPTRPAGRRRAT